jgi:hypothetical protein
VAAEGKGKGRGKGKRGQTVKPSTDEDEDKKEVPGERSGPAGLKRKASSGTLLTPDVGGQASTPKTGLKPDVPAAKKRLIQPTQAPGYEAKKVAEAKKEADARQAKADQNVDKIRALSDVDDLQPPIGFTGKRLGCDWWVEGL